MNELMIVFEHVGHLFFHTCKKTVREAYEDFEDACNLGGINPDNMRITDMILLDKKNNVLDIVKCE